MSDSDKFDLDGDGVKACVSCGLLTPEGEMYFGDDGLQCSGCYHDEEATRSWDKGISGQAAAPIGLGLLSLFCNPCLIVTIMTLVASANNVRLAMAGRSYEGGLSISTKQQVFLWVGAIIGALISVLRIIAAIIIEFA